MPSIVKTIVKTHHNMTDSMTLSTDTDGTLYC